MGCEIGGKAAAVGGFEKELNFYRFAPAQIELVQIEI